MACLYVVVKLLNQLLNYKDLTTDHNKSEMPHFLALKNNIQRDEPLCKVLRKTELEP